MGIYAESTPAGVMVAGVVPDGPAAQAGMREGDVILAVNFREAATRPEVYRALWKQPAGSVIRFTILRDSEHRRVEVASVDRAEFYR